MEHDSLAPSNGLQAVDTLRKVLIDIGWDPKLDEETAGFVVEFDPPYIPISTAYTAISVDLEQFLFLINLGVAALPEQRDEVCRFISRANWRLLIGHFEMDYEDGHARFKVGINFANTELSEALVRNTIFSALNAIEVYADPLIGVISGRSDAEQAIKQLGAKSK